MSFMVASMSYMVASMSLMVATMSFMVAFMSFMVASMSFMVAFMSFMTVLPTKMTSLGTFHAPWNLAGGASATGGCGFVCAVGACQGPHAQDRPIRSATCQGSRASELCSALAIAPGWPRSAVRPRARLSTLTPTWVNRRRVNRNRRLTPTSQPPPNPNLGQPLGAFHPAWSVPRRAGSRRAP
jgi:hypothetical protein